MSLAPLVKLVHHLLQLQRDKVTGALTVSSNQLDTVVYFENGRAVYAESPSVSQTLGRLLLETGVITHQQYTMAIGELRRTAARDRSARLGGVLVNLGFTTVEEVQDALVRQMARRVASLMQEGEPAWTWRAGKDVIAKQPRYPMRVEPLILEGIRLFFDRARITAALAPYRGGFIMLRAPIELIARCFSLTAELAQIAATIDGKLVIDSWLMEQENEDAWPLVTALALTGVLGVVKKEPTRASIEEEATRSESLAPPGSTGVFEVPKVAPVAMPIDPAFAVAAAPKTAGPSPEQLRRLEAESACRIGIDLLHAGEFGDAEKQFRTATRAMPKVAEYQLYWSFSRAKLQAELDEDALGDLERLAAVTARQDSLHPFPPYVSAVIALARGDEQTAMRFFKVAYHRDRDNRDAGDQLRRLERARRR